MATFYAFQRDDPAFLYGVDMRNLPFPELSAIVANSTHYSLNITSQDRSVNFYGANLDWFEYDGFSIWPTSGTAGSAIFNYRDKYSISILEAKYSWAGDAFSGYDYEGVVLTGFNGLIAGFLAGDDVIQGSSKNDYLLGYEGNDVIEYLAGNDVIDGGPGTDTTKFMWPQNWYQITRAGNTFDVTQTYGGSVPEAPENTAHLISIERLVFGNQGIAFDLGGAAGQVARLISAGLGKDALNDKSVVGEALYYIDTFGLEELTEILQVSGLITQFAGGSDANSVIQMLHTNIIGRAATALELQDLSIAAQGLTQAQLLQVAVSLEQTTQLIGLPELTAEGLSYTPLL